MKKNRKLRLLKTCIICLVFCAVAILVINIFESETFQRLLKDSSEIEEYMKSVPRNGEVVYVDATDTVYFHDKAVKTSDNIIGIIYVTDESFFYTVREDGYARVYKSNHDFTESTLLLSYESAGFNVFMKDENKIFYTTSIKNKLDYYVRHINENETKTLTKEEFNACRFANDYYSVNVVKEHVGLFGMKKSFEITNRRTGETKYIDDNFLKKILEIEEAKKLEGHSYLYYKDYILKDDRIYIACASGDFITVYQYNFETEEVTFVDWMNMRDIGNTEIIDIYVF